MKKKVFVYILLILNLIMFLSNILIDTILKKNYNIDLIVCTSVLFATTLFILLYVIKDKSDKHLFLNIGLIFLVIYNVFLLNGNLNFINLKFLQKVPNFTDKSYQEIIKWSSKNNIIVNEDYEYSDTIKSNYIVYQSDINKPLFKIKEIKVIVSDGKDPNKEVSIPDMSNMKFDDVIEFIEDNNLTNVKIEYEDSDLEEDMLISQSKVGNIRRNEEVTFTFSRGDINTDEVTLKDLTNISKLRATSYLKKYKIDYELEDDFSDKIKYDFVISQSISKGTKIKTSDEKIKLTISKGKQIKVPDLDNMSLEEIIKWTNDNKIKLEVNKKYDDTVKKDKIISSNYKKGDSIKENDKLILTISKGNITMKEFSSLSDFINWAKNYSIATSIDYEFSNSVPNGSIIGFSHKKGDVIKNNDTIVVTISNGDTTAVPNFIGMKKSLIVSKCNSMDLNCSFQYQDSSKAKDTAVRQSLSAGSKLAKGASISITLSSGKENTTSSSNNNNNTNNSNNSNKNSNNN
ncbi:MAG: PASTA domain-containing protein, partial [Bacilli bacterium]|nr:PASTA domain-containing protein [Bacilli bacterium]